MMMMMMMMMMMVIVMVMMMLMVMRKTMIYYLKVRSRILSAYLYMQYTLNTGKITACVFELLCHGASKTMCNKTPSFQRGR